MYVLDVDGAGSIGGSHPETILSNGYDVTVIEAMDLFNDLWIKEHTIEINHETAAEMGSDYEFVNGNICDADLIEEHVEEVAYIHHQAAKAGIRPNVEAPRE
ncbi:NAD-dependent epimerase/dehydratase family protein [Natronomonas salina]|uniref:NAD-dependent epimerase/dehydratase family protein n=1 Tax=Natronomonas salina TaxID=1710540 RepID=UPI0015B57969|nr:NAD-dependent epimerase/dehydratase family protein [Natronomonas salina]QLD90788.1 NAD-dependent epimerase/dehydratase family protein [Natronomonas salina]